MKEEGSKAVDCLNVIHIVDRRRRNKVTIDEKMNFENIILGFKLGLRHPFIIN